MKKLSLILACVFLFAAAGCKKKAEVPAEAEVEEVKAKFIVGLDDNFPPMGFRDSDNKIVGFDVDLAAETADRMGMELVLQPIDWGSKELELNNNNIDCIWNGLSVDAAREESMLLSKPYLENRMIIIVLKDSPIKTKADLKGKTVGYQAGSTAVKSFENDPISKEAKGQGFENNVLALSDLKIGRVDAVVLDEVVARYYTTKDKDLFRILNEPLSKEVYAVGFKKGNADMANRVEKALDAMKEDGTADSISKKWFGEVMILP